MANLQYAPWSSDIELGFYAALASLKINHDKLDDSARRVLGLYELRPSDRPERSCRMQIHASSLTTDEIPAGYYRAEGVIKNVNTIEDYKALDRAAIIERAGRTIWDAINDGTIYSCPSLLSSFTSISFADLKKYKFTYHFGFPALHSDPQWKSVGDIEPGKEKLTGKETTSLVDSVQTWRYSVDARQHGFFLAKRVRLEPPFNEDSEGRPKTPQTPGLAEELGFAWAVGSLSTYENGFFKDAEPEDRFICFVDPSTYPNNPGWMFRNLLILIRHRWHLDEAQILCYRDTHLRRDQANSIILHLKSAEPAASPVTDDASPNQPTSPKIPMPKTTGWERNDNGKLLSRLVDLSEYMDPARLADQAVDVNLKLIKWRIAPGVDLDIVKNTKCLLLGAGTLGSYVSRILMGWGVRKITFVDNAAVSFSNPVRQPLFEFKDCLNGGAKKATRAAEALAEIYPGIDATGHVMSVPMAGHPITDEPKVKEEYERLRALIEEHDAIFLLMDTRESRWLPTVMAKSAGKIIMNAALGFDTFVVMRQGLKVTGPGEQELGCYFCNDVVAPADSQKDATLDQQCTVTRPGIAPLASSLLVELLVSVLQHPLRAHAPASTTTTSSVPLPSQTGWTHPNPHLASIPHNESTFPRRPYSPSPSRSADSSKDADHNSERISKPRPTSPKYQTFTHPLGALPHQMRGFLNNFSILSMVGQPYDCCSACSDKIINLYEKEGWDFVKRALNEKGWVEEVSGLAEVQRTAEEAMKELDIEGSESEFGGEFGEEELI